MSFAPFVQGSRKCSLKLRTPSFKRLVSLHILPIAHAASSSFYDHLMTDIDIMRLVAQNNNDEHSDIFTFEGQTLYHMHQQSELTKQERDLLSTKRFVAVVEGASETEAEREMETQELALIQKHVKLTMCSQEELIAAAQGSSTDDDDDRHHRQSILGESANFVERYSEAVQSGALYSPEHLKSICDMYSLPFPLPNGLVLQDAYFRPRLAFRHGDCIVNGDVVINQMTGGASLAVTNPQAFHHLRELDCFETIKKLVQECDNQDITVLPPDDEEELSQRHIAVLWGHYHCPKLLKLIMEAAESTSLSSSAQFDIVKDESNGGVCSFSPEIQNYGWTKEMVKRYYNINVEGGEGDSKN